MKTECTPFTHQWVAGPGVDPMSGLRNVCSNCGAGRFEEARVYELEQAVERVRDYLGSALAVTESFRPLALAAKAITDDGWPDFPARGTLPASLEARLDTLHSAYEGIADMVADAEATAARSQST